MFLCASVVSFRSKTVNPYIGAVLIGLFSLLQAQFFPALLGNTAGQIVPDFTLMLVITWSVFARWQWSLTMAFFCGLTFDFFNSPQLYPLGLNALLYTLIALVISFVATNEESLLRRGNNLVRAVPLLFAATLIYRILLLLIGQFLRYNTFQFQSIIQVMLPAALINAAILLFLFYPLRSLSRIGVSREPI